MNTNTIFKHVTFFTFLLLLWSCSGEDDNDVNSGEEYQTEVYLTDAPVDQANVKAVFITVSDVKVNGKSIEGFQKTTVELSSLSKGNTELLGNVNLNAGTTSSIVLVLDNTASDGSTPGNYVLTADNQKKALINTGSQINVNDKAEILASNDNKLILDFDLRKSIVMNNSGEFTFAGNSQLSNSIRVVNEAQTGTVAGTFSNMSSSSSEAVVAFAYKAGTYSNSEVQSNSSGVQFSNAVTSSLVSNSSGNFSLHFLEEGDYELHFIAFSDEDNDGKLEVQGELQVSAASQLELSNIAVDANSTTTLQLTLDSLLNL